MKKLITIFLFAALLITTHAKIQKCFELITRCPKISDPCPPVPARCEENTTISHKEKGCCCMPECPTNETFLDEPHIAADPTCYQPNLIPAGLMGALPGCYCEPGFVRNKLYKCIKEEDCPQPSKNCKKNEEYRECGPTPKFVPTCDNPDPCAKAVAPPVCIKGCFCKDGYVRDKDKKCIKLDKCPEPTCGPGQVYMKCYQNCNEPTCDSPASFHCGGACQQGCFCEKGYVKIAENKCIKMSECGHDEF